MVTDKVDKVADVPYFLRVPFLESLKTTAGKNSGYDQLGNGIDLFRLMSFNA